MSDEQDWYFMSCQLCKTVTFRYEGILKIERIVLRALQTTDTELTTRRAH